jgi:hypothetical protein
LLLTLLSYRTSPVALLVARQNWSTCQQSSFGRRKIGAMIGSPALARAARWGLARPRATRLRSLNTRLRSSWA